MSFPLTEKQGIVFGLVFIAIVLYGVIVRIIGQDREQRKAILHPRAKELFPLV